jgi:acyl carrier protein
VSVYVATKSARVGCEMSGFASIKHDIAEYLATNFDVVLESIAHDATLEDVGVDSLGILGIATLLENKYGIKFESAQMVQMRTFGDLMDLVKAKSAPPA